MKKKILIPIVILFASLLGSCANPEVYSDEKILLMEYIN